MPLLRMARLTVALAALPILFVACGSQDRQAEVADRGTDVMPFDLDGTTHRFTPQADGLTQQVVVDDPADADQRELVREHLRVEMTRFRAGDYGDPARIHGDHMPGLRQLEAGAAAIEIRYDDVDAGAELRFLTADPALVDALHQWGEAQVADHGSHAG
ncbi:MAG: aspartate carbamoyltransferase [Acidimicrobiales bacterium]